MNKKILFSALLLVGIGAAGFAHAKMMSSASSPALALKNNVNIHTVSSENAQQARDFIAGLGQEAIDTLQTTMGNQSARTAEFDRLLDQNFDMDTIGRFVLGRHWNTATPEQQAEYQELFKDYVTTVYSRRFSEYSGQKFEVVGGRPAGSSDAIVNSVINQGSGPQIKVDWRVRTRNGEPQIVDVLVEGVSMSVTQRSEFSSIIQRNNGQVGALIDHLKRYQS